ncbi:tyrosine--tRNA ligase [Candidatus Shapirobacteria bacterium CG11_big_fil_rev_8_21_14_0_20_40_12]|uniref:Tyrosine--tRNA ligase n=2 Tax=Candidatus Shapironibacteriota TaxID=1752721 RepID=A0A2M8GG69_9BACT|nr:MAG: tyrosine--tRNA ligase [Candidatus Shapirobacteria bacterium CG11_big_fil_rev_8_21_14_0_20_40_12]PJC76305.1 MAG: tyrosine--tRNA ligase [Candidatus Shapirobacteria bacterium CG_4_8_14_3_um_filter_39_11]
MYNERMKPTSLPGRTEITNSPDFERKIEEVLSRGVVEVIDKENLRKRMLRGDIFRIKMGIDPTGPNIHIGRGASLMKLRDFQELGHQVVLIIGDATATVGDSSDKASCRERLTPEQVRQNERNYLSQIGKILDISKVEIHHNSEWIRKIDFDIWLQLASCFTLQQIIERKNYAKRIDSGNPVGFHETLYPLLQGWDSVNIRADVEIGGTDQLFNLNAGRKIQERFGQKSQDILTLMLLTGTDGRKMSTSWGNVILINDPPDKKYGKLMSVPDYLIPVYMECATRIPMERVKEVVGLLKDEVGNPMDYKKELAFALVEQYDGKEAAEKARNSFEKTVQNRELPEVIPVVTISGSLEINRLIQELVRTNLVRSKSEAKRLIEQKGVSIEGEVFLPDQTVIVPEGGIVVKVGKRRYLKFEQDKEGGE